ncbi:hypothetical protein OS493_021045 [Desmophyllum pertusum]|uniref:Uncharacterized protein n=1 Tax=Desmophyllum pertusum TaxID=174260 RepID=A0A9X0A0T1_9CNID|nr:hypothetical protein OS493_021045 [Desmophyllum pertusum]
MDGIAVFLPILCSFLNVYLTSACYYDNDCYGEACCCKRYEDSVGIGLCVNRRTCFGFCRQLDDCSAPEICDTYRNLCTVECIDTSQCHDEYICNYGRCESDEDSNDSSFNVNTIVVVIGVTVAVILLICCCSHHRRRRGLQGANANANTASRNIRSSSSTNITSRGTHAQQNGDARTHGSPGFEMTRSSSLPAVWPPQQDEESNDQIPDAIAEDGPPSYVEVNRQPELPPPTYEEIMRASHEILPQN